jgi:hypothetical protein
MLAQTAANSSTSSSTWIAIVVGVIVVIALIWLFTRRQRSDHLKKQFGPEYERHVRTIGSQRDAERELAERERRYRTLEIKPLPARARERYSEEWRKLQARFVDEPGAALRGADVLIQIVMRERGYPVGDFNRQTEDLSVEHSAVLDNYRTAHGISEKAGGGSASTEEMRQAVILYRSLFDSLLGTTTAATRETST